MYSKHLYCFAMSATSKMVDMRLDNEEVSFLTRNKITYKKKRDSSGNLFSVDCYQLKEKFCNS